MLGEVTFGAGMPIWPWLTGAGMVDGLNAGIEGVSTLGVLKAGAVTAGGVARFARRLLTRPDALVSESSVTVGKSSLGGGVTVGFFVGSVSGIVGGESSMITVPLRGCFGVDSVDGELVSSSGLIKRDGAEERDEVSRGSGIAAGGSSLIVSLVMRAGLVAALPRPGTAKPTPPFRCVVGIGRGGSTGSSLITTGGALVLLGVRLFLVCGPNVPLF